MIKAEKGIVQVAGEDFDVIFELHHLIRSFCEKSPELITAVMYKNRNNLAQAIDKCNINECNRVESVIDYIEHTRKEFNSDH